MKRREFIAGLGSAVAWPLVVSAQQVQRSRHIAVLMGTAESAEDQNYLSTFFGVLQSWGGRGVSI